MPIVATIALLCCLQKDATRSPLAFRSLLDDSTAVGIEKGKQSKNGHPLGGSVVVARLRNGRWRDIWRQQRLNPWKLQLADVDGDRQLEVLVGVYKRSRYDSRMEKRVFLYNWDGSRLKPKWLGSRLTRRFDDFAVADIDADGCSELFALERSGKAHRVSMYRWASFGFGWVSCTADRVGLTSLVAAREKLQAMTVNGSFAVRLVNGRLMFEGVPK